LIFMISARTNTPFPPALQRAKPNISREKPQRTPSAYYADSVHLPACNES
jgi:hypothetical protein